MNGTPDREGALGGFVFRWRSYLPLVVVLGLVAGLVSGRARMPGQIRPWIVSGLALAACGLALRVYAVGHAPPGTSGRHRRQHAERLNTFGIYSVVRHPLYLGNVLVWCGVSLTSGWPVGAIASTLLAVVTFGLIVRHEDAFLARRFGEDFREWAGATPAFLPRPRLWRSAREPFRWRKAVFSEYSTLHSIGLLCLGFAALRDLAAATRPGRGWWLLVGLNSGIYLGLRAWRRSGRAARAPEAPRAVEPPSDRTTSDPRAGD